MPKVHQSFTPERGVIKVSIIIGRIGPYFRRSCTGESTSTAKRAHGEAHVPLRRKSCVRTEPEGGPTAIKKDSGKTNYGVDVCTSPLGVRVSEGDWLHRFDPCGKTTERQRRQTSLPFRRRALASEATFLTPAHQPKTEKKRERKRQRSLSLSVSVSLSLSLSLLLTHMAGRQHSSWPCPWCDGSSDHDRL